MSKGPESLSCACRVPRVPIPEIWIDRLQAFKAESAEESFLGQVLSHPESGRSCRRPLLVSSARSQSRATRATRVSATPACCTRLIMESRVVEDCFGEGAPCEAALLKGPARVPRVFHAMTRFWSRLPLFTSCVPCAKRHEPEAFRVSAVPLLERPAEKEMLWRPQPSSR